MKIRYDMQTPWPTDVENPEGFEAVDWVKHGEIPFVPVAGLMIDNGDGDLRQVKVVYWSADTPTEVAVYFEDEDARPLEYWTRGGWETEDFPMPKKRAVRKRGVSA